MVADPMVAVVADPMVIDPMVAVVADPMVMDPMVAVVADPMVADPMVAVVADPMVADPMVAVVADPMVIDLQPQRLAERLADLTNEQLARVTAALLPPHNEEVLVVEKFGIPVTRRICKCLSPKLWLNDEIINYYMQMLQEWDKRLCEADRTRKPSHFFNLFFMTKLLQNDIYTYASVKR
jgi:hypothetical protein